MFFALRTRGELIPNKLTQVLLAKKSAGECIVDLTQSNPTLCGFDYFSPMLLTPLSDPQNLVYDPHPHGALKAREAVCAYYAEKKIKIDPEQVFLTASTSEAYAFVFRLLADPWQEALIPAPGYPLLDYLCAINDVAVRRYPLIYEKSWAIDLNFLEKCFDRRPKALVAVHPNNPTGHWVSEREKDAIYRLCEKAEAAVISDEVFLDFGWDRKAGRSFAWDDQVLTFTLSGVSKILGLPQMKLSWIVVTGPAGLRRQAIERLELIADTYLSVSTPSQSALSRWFKDKELIRREILERALANRKSLADTFADHPKAAALEAESGWYSVLKVKSDLSDEALALELLQKENILVHPGYLFDGFGEGNFLVVSLLPQVGDFQKAVKAISKNLGVL
jgi:aspartate/methionine/tyrosine aminotransferase